MVEHSGTHTGLGKADKPKDWHFRISFTRQASEQTGLVGGFRRGQGEGDGGKNKAKFENSIMD